MKVPLLLLGALVWATIAFAANMAAFFRSDPQVEFDALHDIHEVLVNAHQKHYYGPLDRFVDEHYYGLNRSRMWHAITAMVLMGVSVSALKSRVGQTMRASANKPVQPTPEPPAADGRRYPFRRRRA